MTTPPTSVPPAGAGIPSGTDDTGALGSRNWQAALGAYLDVSAEQRDGAYTSVALQWELRELTPRTTYRWNGPTSSSVKKPALEPPVSDVERAEYRLAVRPVVRTARGWARGGLTWGNLPHMVNRLNLNPDQHRWLCQFVAIHRAGLPLTPGADGDWVFLDEFHNPVLWSLLDQATAAGVEHVAAGTRSGVHRARRASLSLDIRRTETKIVLDPVLMVDDRRLPLSHARAIGDHGIYTFTLGAPRELSFAPVQHSLSPEQRALLCGTSALRMGLEIPNSGAEEFLAEYLPPLRSRIQVRSSDDSVVLPSLPAAALVLHARYRPRSVLDLSWSWDERGSTGEIPQLLSVLPAGTIPDAWLVAEGGARPGLPLSTQLTGIDAAEATTTLLPRLSSLPGVRVEREGKVPAYRELTGTPELQVTTMPSDRNDWFDLGVIVTVDGRDIPFTPLFTALAKGRQKLLLVDGSYLSLKHPAFIALKDLIEESRDLIEWEAGPRISRYQTALWSDFEDLADVSTPALEWRALLGEAAEAAPSPVEPPEGLIAELRPYQAEGFSWLAFLWKHQLGGILADDMGLGKTLQCLALIEHARPQAQAPFLVVAPTSVVSVWAQEAQRFAPNLRVHTLTATQARSPRSIAAIAAEADLVVTSYALLRIDAEAYTHTTWAGLILDEAQFVKNSGSRVHEVAKELPVRFKLAVTGTPMENSLTELHALCAIVAPGLFASQRLFGERFVRPIEALQPGITRGRGGGRAPEVSAEVRRSRVAELRRRIRPFLLRRVKEQVATELPAKQEQTLMVTLSPEHRALYDQFLQRERQKLFGLLEDLDRNRFIVFRSLTLLRMLALDARLIDENEYRHLPSAKLDLVMDQLGEVISEGHRTLVFSQFTSYLRLAAQRLEAAGIDYVLLDGSTRHRDRVIAQFREGQAPVFLISLKAGGFGLTLTEADYVFLLDPWWNPASEDQAIDRTHRIGQDKNVFVYRLIAQDTIEEKVMTLKERKAALFDAVIDEGDLFSESLTAEDIRELLA